MESKRFFFCGSHGNQHLQTHCYFHTFPLRKFLTVLPNNTFKRPKIDRLWIHLYNHLHLHLADLWDWSIFTMFWLYLPIPKRSHGLLNRLPIGPVQRHQVNSLRGQLEKKDAELDAARPWRWETLGAKGLKMDGRWWGKWIENGWLVVLKFLKWCMEPCCWCWFHCHRIGWYSIYSIDDVAWHGRN